jgi:hypothetical protein
MGSIDPRSHVMSRTPRIHRLLPGIALGILLLAVGLPPATAQTIRAQDLTDQTERVERELERTRDIMERVGEQVREADIPIAKELFEQAVMVQAKARVRFRFAVTDPDQVANPERILGESLQLTLQARDLTLRSGQILHEQVSQEERARRAIDRASTLLDRLRERVGEVDDRRLRVTLEEAGRQIDAAQRHLGDRNYEVALRLAESALKLLNTVNGGAEGGRDWLEQDMRRTLDAIERVRSHAGELDAERRAMLDRVSQLMDLARRAFSAGEFGQARRLNRESRAILARLLPTVRVEEQDVQRGLARFDADLEHLRSTLASDAPAKVHEMMQRAVEMRERAGSLAVDGDYARALQQLRVAQAQLERAAQLAGAGN